MIYLCNDKDKVHAVIDKSFGCSCIRNIILLYLNAYGADYDFAQFYVQESSASNTATAIILRYNQNVYSVSDIGCDICELSSFLSGFAETQLISDIPMATGFQGSACAVMSKQGMNLRVQNADVIFCNEPKAVCSLVCENMPDNRKTDFFLNTAHQIRHNLLSVFAYIKDSSIASVASVFDNGIGEAVIPFVYTGEYFRGNGYSKTVLDSLCVNPQVTYQLLCEEHNIIFYEKCGFSQVSTCYKYCL